MNVRRPAAGDFGQPRRVVGVGRRGAARRFCRGAEICHIILYVVEFSGRTHLPLQALGAEERQGLLRQAHQVMAGLSGGISPAYPLVVGVVGFGSNLHEPNPVPFVALFLATVGTTLFRLYITGRFEVLYARDPARWCRWFNVSLLAVGSLWSATLCWALHLRGIEGLTIFGLLFSSITAVLCLNTLTPNLPIVRAFLLVNLVPIAVTFADSGGLREGLLALFALPFLFHLWRLGRRLHDEYWDHAVQTKLHAVRSAQYEAERERLVGIRRQLESEVEKRVADYRQIFESAHDAIFVLDPEGEIVLNVNQRACDLYGYERSELIGRSMEEMSAPSEGGVDHIDATLRLRAPYRFETRQLRRDGEEMVLEVSASSMEYQGRRAILSINRDVTARKRVEAQLAEHRQRLEDLVAQRTADLEQALADLESQNATLQLRAAEMERFTYTISHDLKSPLITISSFLGLLERDIAKGDSAAVGRDMARIQNAVTSMGALLEDLLELARLGRLVNDPEPVDLDDLVAEALDLVSGSIAEAGVVIDVQAPLPIIQGDRLRLLEVLQNLIENAVKFMADQPQPKIEIGVEDRDGTPALFVRDNGLGIDPAYHEQIFGLFQRLNDHEIEGTGVGLALVKRIVELHHQRIWVESAGKGHGSTFYFTLPMDGREAR